LVLVVGYFTLKPAPTTGDWQEHLKVASTAEFSGNLVTVKNIRNFRYGPEEKNMHPGYYDATFDLNQLKKVWYVTEPFNGQEYAAHTFLSFEFEDGRFLAITIEARKTKDQQYSALKGLLRTYPLIYIAADERDVVLLRANLRKDKVYVYPVRTTQERAQKIFVDMLESMNEMQVHPVWYNTLFANCTSRIVYHINRVVPERVPLSWKVWLTGYADELAYDLGLLDTTLPLDQARAKYLVTEISQQVGDVPDYSKLIRAKGALETGQ
jgi:hypothetical protein